MKRLWKLQPKMCGALLLGVTLFPSIALAEDGQYLNLYGSGSTQSILLEDVDKITFGEDAMKVALVDKTVVSVLYNDFMKLTFGDKVQNSAVESINPAMESSLVVRYQTTDCTVIIKSDFPIEGVAVYNMQGRLMHQSTPRVETMTVSLADYPEGVYIINVNNGGMIKAEKIIKQ